MLSDHAFGQLLATLLEVLEPDGDLADFTDRRQRNARYLRIEIAAPGFGLPRRAVFEYEQWYAKSGRGWRLIEYEYEIRFVEAHGGRWAYHLHDGVHHIHCEERGGEPEHEHYRSYEVDLLKEAHPDLVRIYVEGRIDCDGLHAHR